ncbi:hypothetical protein N7G274_010518 [Stereocaulon virgatum]|uniref:Uncharacterized protein n=1 Tax=Stereocaulon virgatum TaxID=373712 RepID=A0ABR3ZVG0_9LECA
MNDPGPDCLRQLQDVAVPHAGHERSHSQCMGLKALQAKISASSLVVDCGPLADVAPLDVSNHTLYRNSMQHNTYTASPVSRMVPYSIVFSMECVPWKRSICRNQDTCR